MLPLAAAAGILADTVCLLLAAVTTASPSVDIFLLADVMIESLGAGTVCLSVFVDSVVPAGADSVHSCAVATTKELAGIVVVASAIMVRPVGADANLSTASALAKLAGADLALSCVVATTKELSWVAITWLPSVIIAMHISSACCWLVRSIGSGISAPCPRWTVIVSSLLRLPRSATVLLGAVGDRCVSDATAGLLGAAANLLSAAVTTRESQSADIPHLSFCLVSLISSGPSSRL